MPVGGSDPIMTRSTHSPVAAVLVAGERAFELRCPIVSHLVAHAGVLLERKESMSAPGRHPKRVVLFGGEMNPSREVLEVA